jgi:hypothetical protein
MSLTFDEIVEDYFSHAFGKDWKQFYDCLDRLTKVLPYDYFNFDRARRRPNVYYNPKMIPKLESIKEITKDLRELVKSHYNSEERAQTVAVRLLEQHADLCDMVSDWMIQKAKGDDEASQKEYDRIRVEFGKREQSMEMYYDHWQWFGEYELVEWLKAPSDKDVIIIEE